MRAPVRPGWKDRSKRFLALNPTCLHCGAPATEADHVIPRKLGGIDHWDNLQALCKGCHARKTATVERPTRRVLPPSTSTLVPAQNR